MEGCGLHPHLGLGSCGESVRTQKEEEGAP